MEAENEGGVRRFICFVYGFQRWRIWWYPGRRARGNSILSILHHHTQHTHLQALRSLPYEPFLSPRSHPSSSLNPRSCPTPDPPGHNALTPGSSTLPVVLTLPTRHTISSTIETIPVAQK